MDSNDLRKIDDILLFRNDISPFLVHLTKDTEKSAKENLESILNDRKLKYGYVDEYKSKLDTKIGDEEDIKKGIPKLMSVANYCYDLYELTLKDAIKYFHAISFTETPLDQIHNLLNIGGRDVKLKPYGLVFIKEKLENKEVMPVWYINNINGNKQNILEKVVQTLIKNNPDQAYKILPFITIFGKGFKRKSSQQKSSQKDVEVDFRWEREWRYVSDDFEFEFNEKDVFIGLCPKDDIKYFEKKFGDQYKIDEKPLHFIDPLMNPRYFATKLVEARQRADLKYSVV